MYGVIKLISHFLMVLYNLYAYQVSALNNPSSMQKYCHSEGMFASKLQLL